MARAIAKLTLGRGGEGGVAARMRDELGVFQHFLGPCCLVLRPEEAVQAWPVALKGWCGLAQALQSSRCQVWVTPAKADHCL